MRGILSIAGVVILTSGCSGPQSALDTAGREAGQLASLFWLLLAGAVVLWLLVNGLFLYVTRLNPRPLSARLAESVIIGGGIVFPTVVLAALLGYSLALMPVHRAPGNDLTIRVTGERWWWRVEYIDGNGGEPVVAANEIRLPVGKRTEVKLGSAKVIHSFWIPSLAGKMDMFPGRETRLALEPTRVGIFRGQCAEFCGTSHALMAFQAVTMKPAEFDAWLAQERKQAVQPTDPEAQAGKRVFFREGCGACHTVRGTPAIGKVGPDLTHVGNRHSLAAGALPNDMPARIRWIRHTDVVKPDVNMPAYGHLEEADVEALGAYLEALI